jgi:hypothetical protein
MKLSNLFKKAIKNTATVQKLEKTQLSKVIGGLDTVSTDITSSDRAINQSGIAASSAGQKGKAK